MPSTLEQRIEHLFPDKGNCLKEIACIFVARRGLWLVQEDIINLLGKKYANSTICSNFKKLSLPMKEIENNCYIETNILKNTRGRPTIRGRLSEAASERIFKLVPPVSERPKSKSKIGRIVVPSMKIPTNPPSWLPSESIVALRKQKIGEKETDCLLRDIADNKDAPETTPFAQSYFDFKNYQRPGPRPCWHCLTDAGLREFASDTNQTTVILTAYLAPNWVGTWDTDFGKLEIINEHPRYIGRYSDGTIEGRTEADTLIGTWHEGANSGDFQFTMFAGGHSFWGDRYDGAHRRLKCWNGRMIGHEKRGLK
jgi:hypothetical protein